MAGVPLGPLSVGAAGQPWFVRLARDIHLSELGAPWADPEPDLRELMADDEVRGDLDALRLCRNALGCHLIRLAQRAGSLAGDPSATTKLVGRASEQFEAAGGLPEAAINLAAARIEQARLAPSGASDALDRARLALAGLDADALGVPSQPDSFLGLRARGSRVALLIDASAAVPADARAAASRAVLATMDALGPQTRLGVWTFGDDVRGMPATGDDPLPVDGHIGPSGTSRESVRRLLGTNGAGGPGGMLRAIEAAAAARATDILVFAVPSSIAADRDAERLGTELARKGITVDALVLAPEYPSDARLRASCADGALGAMVRHTKGRMRVLLGGTSCALSGQSCRELAEREGRWTPTIDRQFRAVRAQLQLAGGHRGPSLEGASADISHALAPLSPDPVSASVGPAGGDLRGLMLAGAIALHRADRAGADQFLRAAAELAAAEADSARDEPRLAAALREHGARAELLRAMHGTPADQCLAHARKLGLLAGSWSLESWSARLLSMSEGWPGSYRAGRSLSDDPDVRARQERELAACREWVDGGCRPPSAAPVGWWGDLPGAGGSRQQGDAR